MAQRPHSDKGAGMSQDPNPVARTDPARLPDEVQSRWRRIWSTLRSRFARQMALVALAIGTFAAVGHFIGGMIGWWHAYEITFGGHKGDPTSVTAKTSGGRTDVQSLVLLPLIDESEVRDGDWFVDMLTNDLTAELSRMPGALTAVGSALVRPRSRTCEVGH